MVETWGLWELWEAWGWSLPLLALSAFLLIHIAIGFVGLLIALLVRLLPALRTLPTNPVLRSELRGRMRGRRAMIMLTIYLSITGIVMLLLYLAVSSSMGMEDMEAGRTIGKAVFITVMTTALVQVCLIIPTLTAGSIAGEKERQTYDLLLISTLSPAEIVLGKMAAQLAFAMLMIMAVLPMAGLAFIFGGVSGVELLVALVGLCATALLYASEGMFWSTRMKTVQGAMTMAIGTVVLVLLIIPFLFTIISIIFQSDWELTRHWAYIYGVGAMLSLHPFIALGISAVALSQGEPLFTLRISGMQGDLIVPSPWLVYTVFALVLSLVLIGISIMLVKPAEYTHTKKPKKG